MFIPQSPITELTHWATTYNYPGEETFIQGVALRIKQQGSLMVDDLIVLCKWKSSRIHSRCASIEKSISHRMHKYAREKEGSRFFFPDELIQHFAWKARNHS